MQVHVYSLRQSVAQPHPSQKGVADTIEF